jgi:beta-glucosidase
MPATATTAGFPANFAWGTATAAYQIEGAARADGKGESIWDRFTRVPGAIHQGETGDVACDHYHRWRADVELMAELGLNAYRFSISWPRVVPMGRGAVNTAGLDFYDALVDALLERGIAPYVTLYHWDLPQALEDRGGWRNRDTALAFAEYAGVVAHRLGDRVRHWITLNEPQVAVYLGHVTGEMAPGVRDLSLWAPVAHHLLLAHGVAVPILRAASAADAQVGITLNLAPFEPASASEDDRNAARFVDGLFNRWFLDPIFRGGYPPEVFALLAQPAGMVQADDMATIAAPLDFLGVNYYTRFMIRAGVGGEHALPVLVPETGPGLTEMGWFVYPTGLYDLLLRLRDEYAPARMFITENGAAYPDLIAADGAVHDPERVAYLRAHFAQAQRAIADGVPLLGYFVWSLMDNFEWALGYSKRFGIYYVDYQTQQRILKDSGRYLSEVAGRNGTH